jgi:hypothetical protein
MGAVTLPPIQKGAPYPDRLLIGRQTALVVFAAAFHGLNDASWIADADLRATCVDLDAVKLDEMADIYPRDWAFVCADAYDLAARTQRQWDVVSCDPFTNEMQRCADNIEDWCRLARHAVILGTGTDTVVDVPDGWFVTGTVWRTGLDGGVYWTTLERP